MYLLYAFRLNKIMCKSGTFINYNVVKGKFQASNADADCVNATGCGFNSHSRK